MFKTQISTLTKYPDSMLAIMFQHTANGLAPMPMTKDGAYFLDANPLYFGEILDYLRHGKIVSEDPNVLKGTLALANYFGLDKLLEELKVLPMKNNGKNPEMLQSEILHIIFEDLGTLEFILREKIIETVLTNTMET